MQYILSETYFFRQTGTKVEAGGTVELPEADADALNASHPGLLKAVRMTAQAKPTAVREEAETKTVQAPKKRQTRIAK